MFLNPASTVTESKFDIMHRDISRSLENSSYHTSTVISRQFTVTPAATLPES
jgi:hypothetical protein